ncbi:MAG TPA: hypothetical protein VI160_01050 [Gemmatimonadales bacterium]
MRRSMVGMFLVSVTMSTALAAQSRLSIGLAATLGSGWQIEGGEVGVMKRAHFGPFRAWGGALRLASFIDEGAIIGGGRGIISGLALSARTGELGLAEMGDERNVTTIGLNLSIEASGYLATNSPLPEGGHWAGVALLPGLRFGSPDGTQYQLMVGPALFFDRHQTDLHTFLGIRFEMPLAKHDSRP